MSESISAADANRNFSLLLRGVREGKTYVVTSHGRPVAKIAPLGDGESNNRAQKSLFARLKSQPAVDIGPWTREELYEDDS